MMRFFTIATLLLCLINYSCSIDSISDPISISGTVKDSSGEKISDVKIKVKTLPSDIEIETSAEGRYSFNPPTGGTATIYFSKEGYTSQYKTISFKGGDEITIDILLTTLSEDAYFSVDKNNFLLKNTAGYRSVVIKTNVAFEAECDADWVELDYTLSSLFFYHQENTTQEERTAIITLKAEYGFTETIVVKQEANISEN